MRRRRCGSSAIRHRLTDVGQPVLDQQTGRFFKIGPDVPEDVASAGRILVKLDDAGALLPLLVSTRRQPMDNLGRLDALELGGRDRLPIIGDDHFDREPSSDDNARIDLMPSQPCPHVRRPNARRLTTQTESFDERPGVGVKRLDALDGVGGPSVVGVGDQPVDGRAAVWVDLGGGVRQSRTDA